MKSAKQLSRIKVRASLQGSIKKSAVVKKSQKSFGGQPKRKSECPSEQGEYNSDKSLNPENISKMPLDINQRDKKVHHPSKIKLQLLPLDERTHAGLEKDGRNPFLELTLSARKKISSVLTHLFNKWGNSSIALGELTLFPFNAVVENLTAFKSWSSRDSGITVGDVHSAVGSPEIFRLRYGWISSHLNSFTSPTVCSRLECAGSGAVEAASGLENQTNAKNKELVPRIMNGKLNKSVRMTALSNKPSNSEIQTDQALVNSEVLKPSQTTEIERHSIEERHYSTEPVRLEANVQNGENGCNAVQKPSAEPLPCSAGVYNNENSLGLSSIRWSDSLGPFDIPLIPRQITKDDSLSLGGFFR
ncbi:uncharacterized protein LOC141634131 isoform X3 [Silene latifolia]|uniref:uncharacterized protein LOC141634131 isoform X3 n=1 Tax=Silene latifolia TaxID=37657 RepID=UPI003D782091